MNNLGNFIIPNSPTLGLFLLIGVVAVIIYSYTKRRKLIDTDYFLMIFFVAFVYLNKKGISFDWITDLGNKYFPDIQNPTPIVIGIFALIFIWVYNYYTKQKLRRKFLT